MAQCLERLIETNSETKCSEASGYASTAHHRYLRPLDCGIRGSEVNTNILCRTQQEVEYYLEILRATDGAHNELC